MVLLLDKFFFCFFFFFLGDFLLSGVFYSGFEDVTAFCASYQRQDLPL